MNDDAGEIFNNDIQVKKSWGRKHSKTGGIVTPFDLMKPHEKRKLIGKVESYNMYENIITKTEFENKTAAEKKTMLTVWRSKYTNAEIMEKLEIGGQGTFAALLKSLGVPNKTRGGNRRGTTNKIKTAPAAPIPAAEILGGLNLEYNGVYNSEEINKIFTKLQLLTDGENNSFKLTIQLKECK